MKYNKMNKVQLTAIVAERNIENVTINDTKAAIIAALEAYDAEHPVEGEEKGAEQAVEGKEKVTKMTVEDLLGSLRNTIAYPEITYKEGINARKGSIIVNDGKSRICRVSPTRKHTFTIVTSDGKRKTVEDLSIINDMILARRQQAAEKKAATNAKKEAKKSKKTEEPKTETTEK